MTSAKQPTEEKTSLKIMLLIKPLVLGCVCVDVIILVHSRSSYPHIHLYIHLSSELSDDVLQYGKKTNQRDGEANTVLQYLGLLMKSISRRKLQSTYNTPLYFQQRTKYS